MSNTAILAKCMVPNVEPSYSQKQIADGKISS